MEAMLLLLARSDYGPQLLLAKGLGVLGSSHSGLQTSKYG